MHLKTFIFVSVLIFLVCGVHSQTVLHDFINKLSNSTTEETETGRRRKKDSKYMMPLLFGALMVKSIIFPLAFKTMAVMSSIAVLLSTMSLIISSIVGYIKLATKSTPVKVVHARPLNWAKDDENSPNNYRLSNEDYNVNAPETGSHYYINKYGP